MNTRKMIFAFGPDKQGLVEAISSVVARNGFSIGESRMAVLGDRFNIMMEVAGDKDNALERDLKSLNGLTVTVEAVGARQLSKDVGIENIRLTGDDNRGIVHEVSDYLKSWGINVAGLDTAVVSAPHFGTPHFIMDLTLEIPGSVNREAFLDGLEAVCQKVGMALG